MKTSELTGLALDWAVAKCDGRTEPEVVNNFSVAWYTLGNTHYSTDWALGGPIIERELISIQAQFDCANADAPNGRWYWQAATPDENDVMYWHEGPSPLVAACRCYVASKLGDDVDIPEELQ